VIFCLALVLTDTRRTARNAGGVSGIALGLHSLVKQGRKKSLCLLSGFLKQRLSLNLFVRNFTLAGKLSENNLGIECHENRHAVYSLISG
jgi:hypothetical protein